MDTVFPLLAPHEHPRLIDYQTARAHGEPAPSRYEFQGVRRDGSRIWLEALVTAVRWQGSPASQVTVLDITERKHWEGHIRQAQIFTTKPIGEGAGMGLAMDHGIVTNHGGAITVDSTPDDGTTITLYLPRIEDAPAQPAPPQRNFLCVV